MRWLSIVALLVGLCAAQAHQEPPQPVQHLRHEDDTLILSWLPEEDAPPGTYSWVYYSPLATTFTAPLDSRLLGYRVYWSGDGRWAEQTYIPFTALLYADDDGSPTGPPRLVHQLAVPRREGWFTIDLSGEDIRFTEGEVFHPGWTYGEYDDRQQLVDPGAGTGLFWLSIPGSGACWYTDYDGGSPVWLSSDYYYAHMVEVIVEPLEPR